MTDEEYVRSKWERVRYIEEGLTPDGPCYVVISGDNHVTAGDTLFMKHGSTRESVFYAARSFTERRLEEIRQVGEEVSLLSGWRFIAESNPASLRILARTLARTQQHLDTLKRGLR